MGPNIVNCGCIIFLHFLNVVAKAFECYHSRQNTEMTAGELSSQNLYISVEYGRNYRPK